jgi:predicted GNAT family N-acyltransferase
MNLSQWLSLYDLDQRIHVRYPDIRREETTQVVRHVALSESQDSMVIYSRLDAESADEVIRAEIEYFNGIGQDFEWKVYSHDQPPDLKQRLERFGFEAGEEEAIMALDLVEAPDVLWQPVIHDIRRVTNSAVLKDVLAVEREVWQEDQSHLDQFLGNALRETSDQVSIYTAFVNEKPTSAAWAFFPEGSQFVSLWGGSTIEEFRGQGLYTALLAVRAQEARSRGVKYLTVDASPMSRPILEKFGFIKITESYPCMWRKDDR